MTSAPRRACCRRPIAAGACRARPRLRACSGSSTCGSRRNSKASTTLGSGRACTWRPTASSRPGRSASRRRATRTRTTTSSRRRTTSRPPLTPLVDSIDTPFAAPGTLVTIRGKNFGSDASLVRVWIDTVKTKPLALNDETIEFTVPAGARSGYVRVHVGGRGKSGGVPLAVTPDDVAPSIVQISPPNGRDGARRVRARERRLLRSRGPRDDPLADGLARGRALLRPPAAAATARSASRAPRASRTARSGRSSR